MKASEFRIGDLVMKMTPSEEVTKSIGAITLDDMVEGIEVEPIQITPELLKRFGFSEEAPGCFEYYPNQWDLKMHFEFIYSNVIFEIETKYKSFRGNVASIHEVQDIFKVFDIKEDNIWKL